MQHISVLGQNIRYYRTKKKMSQRILRKLSGCSTIGTIEAGFQEMTRMDHITRIAQVLEVEVSDLFNPLAKNKEKEKLQKMIQQQQPLFN